MQPRHRIKIVEQFKIKPGTILYTGTDVVITRVYVVLDVDCNVMQGGSVLLFNLSHGDGSAKFELDGILHDLILTGPSVPTFASWRILKEA